jgi:hypothetical protein
MFTVPSFERQNDSPTTRRPQVRRRCPLVEALEGRQLLATFAGTTFAPAVGNHIGDPARSGFEKAGGSWHDLGLHIALLSGSIA